MVSSLPLQPDQIPFTPSDLSPVVADAYDDVRDLIDIQLDFAALVHDTPAYIDPITTADRHEPIDYDNETLDELNNALRDAYADAPADVTITETVGEDTAALALTATRSFEYGGIPIDVIASTGLNAWNPKQWISLFVDPTYDEDSLIPKTQKNAAIYAREIEDPFPEIATDTTATYAFTIVPLAHYIRERSFFTRAEAECWLLSHLGVQPGRYSRRWLKRDDFEAAAEKMADIQQLYRHVAYMDRLNDQGVDAVLHR